MKKSLFLTAIFMVSVGSFAEACPINAQEENYTKLVGAAIRASETCETGVAIAQSCAFQSSLDSDFTVVAERKCGLDFWKKLTPDDIKHYNALQDKCNSKYDGMLGQMYNSFAAFCRLNVARLYSEVYSPGQE